MILVTGATGFVGQKIMQMCGDVLACPSLRDVTEEEIRRITTEIMVLLIMASIR